MKIAAVQMVSTPELGRNLEAAGRLIAEAAAGGARLVSLPEYFCLLGHRDTDKLAHAEAAGDGPIQRFLAEAARRHGLWLIGGTLPLASGSDERVLNSNCVFAPDGTLAARYDKIHLFAFDNGRERYDEGRTLHAGSQPQVLQAGALRVGLSICYDLRFPELYRAMMSPPCDLLSVPAAFTYTTGRAHWELLLRARAVENQCYVLAAAQGGTHENGRRTWGHSMIVDPWGEVLAVRDEGEGVVIAELDAERIAQVRQQLPALAHQAAVVAARRDFIVALREAYAAHADPARAPAMQAYMKSAMPFRGIPAPERRRLAAEVLKRHPMPDAQALHDTMAALWREAAFREERYAAMELARTGTNAKLAGLLLLALYERMIREGAWWDICDDISAEAIGELLRRHPDAIKPVLRRWATGDDLWLRRAAFLSQRRLKREFDAHLFYETILPSLGDSRFFINKGLGWALRERSYAAPDEVKAFCAQYADRLSALTKREAMKALKRRGLA